MLAASDELTAEYWASLDSGDQRLQDFLAKLVVDSKTPPTSDAYYSALCVLLASGGIHSATRAIEKALLSDFEGCQASLLPLLGHAHQLSMDAESAHLVFETCSRLGLFSGKNAWAAEAANEVTYMLAEHALHKGIGLTARCEPADVDSRQLLARALYEGHFSGARDIASRSAGNTMGGEPLATRFPDFIIAGSAKCGTTYLYDLVCRSDSVWDRRPKEIHYFSSMHRFGPSFYAKFFELCPDGLRCGEASPDYLDVCNSEHPEGRLDTALGMRQTCPDVKVIVVLRDPALRAVSLYNQLTSNDVSRGPRPGSNRLGDLTMSDLETYWQGQILISGTFINPLRRFVEVLGRQRVLVLSFPELMDVEVVSARVSSFLDIEPPPADQFASLRRNAGGHDRPSSQLYGALREYYHDSLADLESEFGIQL
jgi:hypothetical protein